MFLSDQSVITHSHTIRGVRYLTNSFYGGDKDIFQTLERLMVQSLSSSDPTNVTSESLVDRAIASKAG